MKRLSILVIMLISLLLCVPVAASVVQGARLVDNAGLLSASEAAELTDKLDEVSDRQNFDVVVVTTNTLEGKGLEEYSDDFYDYGGYRPDGALLLLDMSGRQWHITTSGYGIDALTDEGQRYMADRFGGKLSDGDFYGAFETFADDCDTLVTNAKEGNIYDVGNTFEKETEKKVPRGWIFGSALIGFLASLTGAKREKDKLKTVRYKGNARDYVRAGSMQVSRGNDIFLYRNISRTLRADDRRKSGGSTIHTGSSGHTHGGSSGKF